MKHIIPCWPEFLRDLIERGNRIDNIEFYDWFQPTNYVIREVFCKPIDCYSIQNRGLSLRENNEELRRQAAPLEFDAKAKEKRERRKAANEKK